MSPLWPSHLDDIVEEFGIVLIQWKDMNYFLNTLKRIQTRCRKELNEGNQILGCQSRAHVVCSKDDDGLFILRAGADAQIVQGLMSITAIAVNGLSPEEVCKLTPVYVEEMGLKSALSPNRANGFLNMFNRVIAEAKILSET